MKFTVQYQQSTGDEAYCEADADVVTIWTATGSLVVELYRHEDTGRWVETLRVEDDTILWAEPDAWLRGHGLMA